jgi:hypothetical protein
LLLGSMVTGIPKVFLAIDSFFPQETVHSRIDGNGISQGSTIRDPGENRVLGGVLEGLRRLFEKASGTPSGTPRSRGPFLKRTPVPTKTRFWSLSRTTVRRGPDGGPDEVLARVTSGPHKVTSGIPIPSSRASTDHARSRGHHASRVMTSQTFAQVTQSFTRSSRKSAGKILNHPKKHCQFPSHLSCRA